MIQVCFPSPHLQPAQECLLHWQLFRGRFHRKVTERDFVNRWSLDRIMSNCGFQRAHYLSEQSSVGEVCSQQQKDAPTRRSDGWTAALWQHRSDAFSVRWCCSSSAFKENSCTIFPVLSSGVEFFPHASGVCCKLRSIALEQEHWWDSFPLPFFTWDWELLEDLLTFLTVADVCVIKPLTSHHIHYAQSWKLPTIFRRWGYVIT